MSKSILFIVILFIFVSCQTTKKEKKEIDFDKKEDSITEANAEYVKKAKFIFYNMSSPIEMAQIFENSGTNFNEEILLNENKYLEFSGSINIAIIMGMYGVDLSYVRMYDQTQLSMKYLVAIKKMAEKLGIPEDFVSLTASNIENNITNRDSIFRIANEAYQAANTYLKGNERENTATLILMGGWIEALYIATSLLDIENPDQELLSKVSEQKYSLNSLITLLKNNEGDNQINEYIYLLNSLNKEFQYSDNLNKDVFEIDNALPESKEDQINTKYIEKILSKIIELRNSITM